jgi:predicted MFS family arabinose efflux permease
LRPVRAGLLACVPAVLLIPWVHTRVGTAALIVVALILIGVLWAPVMVMLSDACAAVGIAQLMVVAMMDLTWPPGNIIGSAGGGALAQAAGERVAYAALAAALLAGYFALGRRASTPERAVADGLYMTRT